MPPSTQTPPPKPPSPSPSPNPPIPSLASTLYTYEQAQQDTQPHHQLKTTKTTPRPRPRPNRTGIPILDRDLVCLHEVFSHGRIIGVGGIGRYHATAQLLMHSLTATHIVDTYTYTYNHNDNESSTVAKVFILEPPTIPSAETSLLQIYDLLSSSSSGSGSGSVDEYIDTVSILHYFDLLGVSEALCEISDAVLSSSASALQSESESESEKKGDKGGETIILLRGLGSTLARTVDVSSRGDGVTRSAALLGEVIRQLGRLRMSGCLVVVEVGVNVGNEEDGVLLHSAFSSVEGSRLTLGFEGDGAVIASGRPGWVRREEDRARTLLLGLVDRVLDALVIVHGGFGIVDDQGEEGGKCVVEVVKDRCGSAFGEWVVWDGRDRESTV